MTPLTPLRMILPLLVLLLGLGTAAPGEAAENPARAPVGIGLAPVSDWSVQQPFLDVMKTARSWIVHRPGQWGGGPGHDELAATGHLDADGWPRRLPREIGTLGTVILTDLPEEARTLAGRYRLSFDGTGTVEVSGRARNVRYGDNAVTFDFTPGPGPVEIRLQRSDPDDYVRNIRVVKEAHRAAYARGEIFNPDWLARIGGFNLLRFMDWSATNHSTLAHWDDRPEPANYTYTREGVPVEVMLALVRETGQDAWFTLPHRADDDFIRRFAQTVRDGLPPDATAYAEFSNEVWNWQFDQAEWADAAAAERWGAKHAGAQYYGMRAAQAARIWSEVFAEDAGAGGPGLVNVITTQTGWLGLEASILEAPLWQAEPDHDGVPPWIYFDAYAVTGYFGGILGTEDRAPMVRRWIAESEREARRAAREAGLDGADFEEYVAQHRYDLASARAGRELLDGALSGDPADTLADLLGRVLPYHAEQAAAHGLDLVMYEGGTHVVGIGARVDDPELTGFFIHFNYTAEMGALYARLIDGWRELGGGVFTAFVDVYRPNKWGSWGNLRTLSDDNPRWQALAGALDCGAGCE